MLLPYALLFFLFTTFVAAVPTMMLQKRFSFDFIMNKEFLAANDGAWTRVESPQKKSVVHMFFPQKKSPEVAIQWTIEESHLDRHGNKEELYVALTIDGETHKLLATSLRGKEEPGVNLFGVWERKTTESKINISIDKYGMFELTVLNAGNYDKEKGSDGFELLANSVDFLTDAGGMWVGIEGEKYMYGASGHFTKIEGDTITFSKRLNPYKLEVLTSSYMIRESGLTTSLSYLSNREPNHGKVVLYSTTLWERKATGSQIEIVKMTTDWTNPRYYFKRKAKATQEGESKGEESKSAR